MHWSEPFPGRGLFVLSYKGGIAQRAGTQRIAAFDLDHTLIRPGNLRPFPTGPHDWEWTGPRVKAILQNLHRQGYGLVILTNQARFTLTGSVKTRIERVVRDLDLPLVVLVGKSSAFRKPETASWTYLRSTVAVDDRGSFFVGDAAGRAGDFSDSDREFARNTGLSFATNTQFFGRTVITNNRRT